MRTPNDSIFGSPSFHYRLRRLEDGTYEATNESLRQHIAPQRGANERDAMDAAKAATEAYVANVKK